MDNLFFTIIAGFMLAFVAIFLYELIIMIIDYKKKNIDIEKNNIDRMKDKLK